MRDSPRVNSSPLAGGNGTGTQAPTTGGNRVDGRVTSQIWVCVSNVRK